MEEERSKKNDIVGDISTTAGTIRGREKDFNSKTFCTNPDTSTRITNHLEDFAS